MQGKSFAVGPKIGENAESQKTAQWYKSLGIAE